MCENKNPLIGHDTHTTLSYARSVIMVLKEFYCLNNIPGKKPPPSVSPELFTGLYFILDNIDEALAYEMRRIKREIEERNNEEEIKPKKDETVIPPLISD